MTLSIPHREAKGMVSLGHEDSARAGCIPSMSPSPARSAGVGHRGCQSKEAAVLGAQA